MAAAVQLSTLRTRARQKANMENSAFVSDAELNQYINESWAELYEKLALTWSDRFTTSEEVTVVAPANTIAPTQPAGGPYGFLKFRGLDKQDGNEWITIEPMDLKQRNRTPSTTLDIAYVISGSALKVYPAENGAGVYRLWYIPYVTELSDDTDTVSLPHQWQQYIVTDAAIKCLVKEESDPAALLIEKAALIERIKDIEALPDADRPKKIQDVTQRDYIGWRRLF